MPELRPCPLCSRLHTVADDGTIPTWDVIWSGNEYLLSRKKKPSLSQEKTARLQTLRAKHPEQYTQQDSIDEQNRVGEISNRHENFIHYEDAISEYNWIKGILIKRGDWDMQCEYLVLTKGDRASWEKLFSGNAEDGVWLASSDSQEE